MMNHCCDENEDGGLGNVLRVYIRDKMEAQQLELVASARIE